MNSFEKLLNTVRKSAPDVISEEVAGQMLDDFNKTYEAEKAASYEDGKNAGYEVGKAAGFEDGYKEGAEKERALAKQEFDELLDKCDEEATNKLKEVVEMINQDHIQKINNLYNLFNNNFVPKVELEELDKDHAKKLTDAVEKILKSKDDDDADKLQKLVDELNNNHAIKLQEIADMYEQKLAAKDEEIAQMDADHAQKFEEAMTAMDEKHAEQFQEAIDALNNDHAKKLENIYESINDDHAKKLQKVYEAIDTEHAKKMKIACEQVAKTITSNYAPKLDRLKAVLKNEREAKLNTIAESIEKYINYALKDAIPTKKLISEAKYNASQKAIEKITSILKINNVLQESKDGIFTDYEAKLRSAKAKQNQLAQECIDLKARLDKEEAKTLLESKVSKCTPAEAAFLRTYFENAKSKRIIEEQIEDARTAFKRIHDERRNDAVSRTTSNLRPSTLVNENKNVKKDEPAAIKRPVVTESKAIQKPAVQPKQANTFISAYAEMLKKK